MLPAKLPTTKTQKLLIVSLMWLCLELVPDVSHVHEIASTAGETTAVQVKVQYLATESTPDPKDTEARQAFARGEALHENWTAVSLREAITHFEQAALLWTAISRFSEAAEATLKAGDIYFLFSEYAPALKSYTNAEALAQRSGDWLVQAISLSQLGRVQSYMGNNDLAQKHLAQAFDLFKRYEANRSVRATNAYAEALSNLAEVSYAKGDFFNASKQVDSALNTLRDDRKGEARARLFKGNIAGSIGETDKAFDEITRALNLYREVKDQSGEGLALTAMGLWHIANENYDRAVENHNQALKIFQTLGAQHSEAVALNAVGQAYGLLNKYPNALAHHMKALTLFENIGASNAAAATACGIAAMQSRSQDLDQALASYEQCRRSSRAAGNVRIEAYALEGIAGIYSAQRRDWLALKQYQILETFFKSIDDRRGQAMALNAHGNLLLEIGEKQKALDVFGQAFSLSETMNEKGTLITTLYNLARANQVLGSHEVALSLIKRSFILIEEIRANVASPDFRASYFAVVERHYDLCIEILMSLHRLRPNDGFAAEAFFVSEQGRARLLLDLLSESRPYIRSGAVKDLVEAERKLRGLLRAQAEYQLSLSLSGKDSKEVDDQIEQLRSDYQAVLAQLREQYSRLFSFEQFAPVDLERIQMELQGSDTMLLEYALGDNQSYVWAITSNSIDTYLLPAGREIENAALEFYKVITARQRSENAMDYQASVAEADSLYSEKANNLSRMLLGPVAEKLGNRRLVIVADGALQYIPFAALPLPVQPGPNGPTEASTSLLVTTNEITNLLSASTLVAIRGGRKAERSPGKLVAVIADPVFSPSDERVQHKVRPSLITKIALDQSSDHAEQQTIDKLNLARLAYASDEADAISAGAPWGAALVAKGFDANRETAMSAEVSGAQIIHFATHSVVDSERPELSGIVLTMMDRNGAKTNGLMTLPDIYTLDLSAELIVLSACQTALGKDIKGEGLVGLTHSFLSADAKSVVASLWKVDDRATTALMTYFYEGMLEKGLTPAAALRFAKLQMMSDKQWSAPYYWAGFVLQGEYTNRIDVNHYGWLRPGLALLILVLLVAVVILIFLKRRRRIRPAQFS